MSLPLLVRISSSPLWLFLTLVGVTLLLHIMFVWVWQLKDATWKYADYVWLFVAALGVLAASGKAGQLIASNELNSIIEPRTEFSYEFLRGEIKRGVSGPACMPHERGLLSAHDFDEFSRANQDVCGQMKKLDAAMPDSIKPPFRPLAELGFRE